MLIKIRQKVLQYQIRSQLIMRAYGPVPSRRLGSSLGVNNIPPKVCTYSCIYCQLGKTIKMQVKRREFYEVEEIKRDVEMKVREAKKKGKK